MRAFLRDRRAVLALALIAAATVLLPVSGAAHACAVCGSGAGTAGDPLARGFYWGVLFLMAMPFAIGGGFGGWLLYAYWRARRGRPVAVTLRELPARILAPLRAIHWTQKESQS